MPVFFTGKRLFAVAAAAVVFLAVQQVAGQATTGELRLELVRYANFTEGELAALEKGEAIVQRVKTNDKRDVAVFGIVRIADLPPVSMAAFREGLSQRGNKEMGAKGRFSEPPQPADLSSLNLEGRDFDELRKCSIGDCDINMSAFWIRRFGSEIDWNASDHRERATELFRAMVLEYASEYALKGPTSLGTHANRKEPLDLARAQNELLKELPLVDIFGFGLRNYMQEYPAGRPSGIQSEMHWSAIDFGLNPTVTLSHAAAFTNGIAGNDSHFVLTRQFYSTRYLDASVSLSALLRVPDGERVDSYIVFADRSRSDALGGILGGVARSAVEAEAIDRVKGLLDIAAARLVSPESQNRPAVEVILEEGGGWSSWLRSNWLLAAAGVLILFGLASFLLRLGSK